MELGHGCAQRPQSLGRVVEGLAGEIADQQPVPLLEYAKGLAIGGPNMSRSRNTQQFELVEQRLDLLGKRRQLEDRLGKLVIVTN